MGRRGPIAGASNAGRPPGDSIQPASDRSSKISSQASASMVAAWARSLTKLTFDELRDHCGRWRDLEPQDHLLVVVLYDLVREYSRLQSYIKQKAIYQRVQISEKTGHQSAIPEISMRDRCRKEMLTLGLKFGLSPGDRARMGDAPKDDDAEDPLADQWQEGKEIHAEQVHNNKKSQAKDGKAKKRTANSAVRSRSVSGSSSQRKKASGKVRKARDRKTAPRSE